MHFKYLNIQKSRQTIVNKTPQVAMPGRRAFMKTLGLGAIAWSPVIDSVKLISPGELNFIISKSAFELYSGDKKIWEISTRYFEKGFSVIADKNKSGIAVTAENLTLKNSSLKFTLQAGFTSGFGEWTANFKIPEFAFRQQTELFTWLNGSKKLENKALINSEIARLNNTDCLFCQGRCNLGISPAWELNIDTQNQIGFDYQGDRFYTDKLIVKPGVNKTTGILKKLRQEQTVIEVPAFAGWPAFAGNLKLSGGKLKPVSKSEADLEISVNNGTGKERGSFLIIGNNQKGVHYHPEKVAKSPVIFDSFFFYAEYLNEAAPAGYISGTIGREGQWMTNQLGSFKIEKNEDLPDFEAFGTGTDFNSVIFEPRLRAFSPRIEQTTTLQTVYQDPPKVRVQPQKKTITRTTVPVNTNTQKETEQQPERPATNTRDENTNQRTNQINTNRQTTIDIQKQDPPRNVREVQKNQPEIEVAFDKLKFKPKNALSIKVLRPEDMVLLEFVFHNFNFTNKGQSPYLELDNNKENGVVEIYFQSQHTLEEAYFESTPIPDPDPEKSADSGVRLPAKHLRARKSRLVYELPAGHEGFPLIMSALLDWSKFNLRVHPRAWIKLPSGGLMKKPVGMMSVQKNTRAANTNIKYLETPSTEYGIKLAQNNKVKAGNLEVYNENEIAKVLNPSVAATLKPSFNREILKKISWKVEPIPDLSTSIEAPTLMYISPNQINDFYHKIEPVFRDLEERKLVNQVMNTQLRVLDPLASTKGEIIEMWHTRLGVKLKNGLTSGSTLKNLKTIRVLWADDADPDYKVAKERNYPFMASLDANNRQKLVHTTSNYEAGFEPFYVPVNDLMLTTLGAYLDWHVFFDVPTPQDNYLNIIEWEHIATLGRDHYVKIVEEGYLFPFGHRAAVVKITERKFDNETKAAANRQRMFVVVLEKEKLYTPYDPESKFIQFPFQAIRIETNATPNIDDPQKSTLINVPSSSTGNVRIKVNINGGGGGANTTYNFYINVAGQGFMFDMVATDKEGNEHAFRMPLAFMENRIARDKKLMEDVIEKYQGKQADGFNKIYNESLFNGREVAYAEYLVDGDTDFETEMIKFDAQIYPVKGEGDLKFHPKMKEARIFVKQINELTGLSEPTVITLEDDNNKGDVFAKVISSNVVDFSGGSDKSGGFLMPNMAVKGLSKLQGPVSGDLDKMKDLLFIPEKFFEAFEDLPVAKIFGVIDVFSLLLGTSSKPLNLGGSFDAMISAVQKIRADIDSLKNEILYYENLKEQAKQAVDDEIAELKQTIKEKVNELLDVLNNSVPKIPNLKTYFTEEAFYAEYKWQPELGGKTIEVFPDLLNVTVNDPKTALSVTTKFEKPYDIVKPASMNGVARFEKFGIDIVPLLAVNFNYLEFRSGSTQKTDVKVDINKDNPIVFKGVLNFVNNLQSIIPAGGFSDDGPYIDIKLSGITAGFNISIPNVEVGICMISNISLGASVTLPFTGAPLTLGFNFCRRENPFMLTISCFGGGGYFMMVTTLKGIQSIEAAFEFGAAMSLNVGVASGGVSAMGGFYYKMEIVEGVEQTTLSGYLRLNGHLSILGLISVSLEFYLAFIAVIYQGKVQKLEGVATLKVKVEVLFFSKTVSVSVRRELKGADADPKFIEMIDEDDWQEYCLAFAG